MLRRGLRARGYEIRVFDQFRGPIVDLLRHRFLATSNSRVALKLARGIKRVARRAERTLIGNGILRPRCDDILDLRCRLIERFRGSDAVIHLAGLPHEHIPGAVAADFERINYEGSINVLEAAREAGVPRFLFASSGQVYKINNPVRLDQFPILESNYCPGLDEGQSMYGWLKFRFEQYLAETCRTGAIQSIALRLEMPGMRSRFAHNFYISTSIENLVSGVAAAIEARLDSGFEAFNLADAVVDEEIVNIQKFLAEKWPHVPNRTTGNECLLSTAKARALLKYQPQPDGQYNDFSVVWN
jgi:nucleoside-diphosphate-sugar epimerase